MPDPLRPVPFPGPGARHNERLESWKEIAAYLGREVRTVQGWEKNEGLPVHRHHHGRLGSVYAFQSELDLWREQRRSVGEPTQAEAAESKHSHLRLTAVIGAAAVLLAIVAAWLSRGTRPPSSIAVLPFVDMSPHHDQEYFSDGLTEEIIDALSRVPNMHVVARTSAFAFKGKAADIREIGRRLSVQSVLEGSVRTDGERLRVTAQLNRASDGYHIWSRTYDRQLRDIFAVQRDISQAIANEFRAGPVRQRHATEDLEAWRLYQEGRYFLNQYVAGAYDKAIDRYRQAIARDPQFALAWASLAEAEAYLAMNFERAPREVMPPAREAAERAIALDANLAEGHIALGVVKLDYDWQRRSGQDEFRRAIELEPGSGYAYHWYAHSLEAQGKLDEAMRQMRHALDLDPLSVPMHWDIGMELISAGRYGEAARFMRRAEELFPNNPIIVSVLADAAFRQGDTALVERARAVLSAVTPRTPALTAILGRIAAREGHRDEAEAALDELERLHRDQYVEPVLALWIAEAAGDSERLRLWFNRARDERSSLFIYLPIWEGRTNNSELRSLLASIPR